MEIAKITVTQNELTLEQTSCVTAGLVGAYVTFAGFDASWEGLAKTAVFRTDRGESRDVACVQPGEPVVIPWELLDAVGADLMVGICGTDAEGTLVIPTVWGGLGRIAPGAIPVGRPAEPPTPDWTQRMEGQVSKAMEQAQAVKPLAAQAAASADDAGKSAVSAAGSAVAAGQRAGAAAASEKAAAGYAEEARQAVNDSYRDAQHADQMARDAVGAAKAAKTEADRAAQEAGKLASALVLVTVGEDGNASLSAGEIAGTLAANPKAAVRLLYQGREYPLTESTETLAAFTLTYENRETVAISTVKVGQTGRIMETTGTLAEAEDCVSKLVLVQALKTKVSLPGTNGTRGQFAVADGVGGILWETVTDAGKEAM